MNNIQTFFDYLIRWKVIKTQIEIIKIYISIYDATYRVDILSNGHYFYYTVDYPNNLIPPTLRFYDHIGFQTQMDNLPNFKV
jgi:hypothetical protein